MRLMRWLFREPLEPPEREPFDHFNAIDRNGKRYTTHHFAGREDWWWGATILTPNTIAKLCSDGLLPLDEVQ